MHNRKFIGGIFLFLRKKTIAKILVIVFFAVISLDGIYSSVSAFEKNEGKKVILIDPGHGGYDGGAEGKSGVKEKEINLSISLKLREKLKEKGYVVVMTREEDKALLNGENKKYSSKKAEDLANRCKIKKDTNPDLFISIHQNHFPEGQYYGAQVWYSKNKESESLAHIIQEGLKADLKDNNKRVEKPAGNAYKIMRTHDDMPSVLVECGFLSNYSEEQRLTTNAHQDKVAESIAKSIDKFLNED